MAGPNRTKQPEGPDWVKSSPGPVVEDGDSHISRRKRRHVSNVGRVFSRLTWGDWWSSAVWRVCEVVV